MKSKKAHEKKHPEVYEKLKEKWEEFERNYWKKHPEEKYCHICGERRNVELHHIIPRHIAPDKIFDEDNLIPLCRACHFRWGHLGDWEKWNPNIKEDAQRLSALLEQRRREWAENEDVSVR